MENLGGGGKKPLVTGQPVATIVLTIKSRGIGELDDSSVTMMWMIMTHMYYLSTMHTRFVLNPNKAPLGFSHRFSVYS